jgi:alpha-N-acetylglucosamine transferase
LITENVAQWKRERLAADGAVVILVPIIQIPNIPSREATYINPPLSLICRWVDQFTKLQLWKLTEYERIVYMDSDLFPLVNTEELFHLNLDQHSSQDPPFNYSFAATPNLVGKDERGQLIIGGGFNAGFFVLKPDQAMFDRIWARAMDPAQPWNMHKDMEQGLLNDIFATNGHSPMHRLEWTWNVKDMPDEFLERSKIVHSRYIPFIPH